MTKSRLEAASQKRADELLRRTSKDVETNAAGSIPETPRQDTQTNKKITFGFKAVADDVERWKLYAKISGVMISDFATAAMDDYIKSHPLTAAQKRAYSDSALNTVDEL